MPALVNVVGERFGRLIAVERAPNEGKRTMWRCSCDCGGEIVAIGYNLHNGHTRSCGCLNRELTALRSISHGHTRGRGSKTYRAWVNAKARCYYTGNNRFDIYGGRGITMCDRWRNSFEAFLADMGEVPPGLTLERNDVNGHYEPDNCRWATPSEQRRNQRPRGEMING